MEAIGWAGDTKATPTTPTTPNSPRSKFPPQPPSRCSMTYSGAGWLWHLRIREGRSRIRPAAGGGASSRRSREFKKQKAGPFGAVALQGRGDGWSQNTIRRSNDPPRAPPRGGGAPALPLPSGRTSSTPPTERTPEGIAWAPGPTPGRGPRRAPTPGCSTGIPPIASAHHQSHHNAPRRGFAKCGRRRGPTCKASFPSPSPPAGPTKPRPSRARSIALGLPKTKALPLRARIL